MRQAILRTHSPLPLTQNRLHDVSATQIFSSDTSSNCVESATNDSRIFGGKTGAGTALNAAICWNRHSIRQLTI
jgi:hypothetical protein